MDTALRSKSEENTKSANLAIQGTHYASSIHCSYYACLQLMGHIQRSDFGMTDAEVENEQDSTQGSSHILLISKFEEKLFLSPKLQNNQRRELTKWFKKLIGDLKEKRKKADYKNVKIEKYEAKECLKMSDEIIEFLTKFFTI